MNILNPEYYINNNDENNNIIVDQSNEQNNTNSNIVKPRLTIKEKDDSILDGYKTSGMEDNVKKKCNEINSNVGQFSKKMKKFIPSFGVQFKFLIKRHLKNIFRDKRIIKLKMAQTFGLGLIIGLTFYNIPGNDDIKDIIKDADEIKKQDQDRKGGLFVSSFAQVLLPMIGTLSIFSSETPVVIREISSGYYTSGGYYFSKIAIEIPFQILSTLISCTIIYILSHFQRKFKKYLKFIGVIELGALCGLSIGLSIATIAKDVTLALQFAPFLVIPIILFSGLFINTDSIPPYFTWIQYISPVRYMYQEVFKNEFYDLDGFDGAVEGMKFDKISSILAIVLLSTITLVLYIFCYLMLYASIKKSLSKTKYISSKGENNIIKPNELNEPLLYND